MNKKWIVHVAEILRGNSQTNLILVHLADSVWIESGKV
jgi:hypothetical protein